MAKIQYTIAKNIKFFRNTKGITQEKLAEKAGVSGSYIGYLERGKKSPSLDLLVKIADVLQVDLVHLLTESNNTKNLELKKLVVFLADKHPKTIRFINEVAILYIESLKSES